MKHPRPNAQPGSGSQPIRFLQPRLLGAFENAAPDLLELLQDQVRYQGANPSVSYDMALFSAQGPEITGTEGTIHLQETFLSYLWGVTYSTLVLYDESIVRPRITSNYVRTPEQQELITNAVSLLGYAYSLFQEYTPWPLETLPNPEIYSASEALYVEKADSVFEQATVFIMLHEYAHFYLGHLASDAEGIIQSSVERQTDEYAADRFAIEIMLAGMSATDQAIAYTMRCGIVVGMGAILLPHRTLDGGDSHPDPHQRLAAALGLLELPPSDNLWGIGSLMLALWAFTNNARPIGGYDYASLEGLFAVSMSQLNV